MISYITGTIEQIREEYIVVDHGGMGYRIFTNNGISREGLGSGDMVRMYTHFHVREDAMQLYGFLTEEEVDVFRLLLGVSGIGPKAALGILTELSVDEIRFAVLSDDLKTISRAPGIGKKTAQKLILELRDKFDLEEAFEAKLEHGSASAGTGTTEALAEAMEALQALGYSGAEALRALRKVENAGELGTEELLKAALKNIF